MATIHTTQLWSHLNKLNENLHLVFIYIYAMLSEILIDIEGEEQGNLFLEIGSFPKQFTNP